ncbi:MAG: hypothetical protein L3J65_02925 [Robiginitomaculum sp.]|nr:hypothetical protein [Robiginitomaculum sp.]
MKIVYSTLMALALTILPANLAVAQSPANAICKTGSDADLPVIKIKIANMASKLKRLKQSKKNSRARTDALRTEILAIDQTLSPWRARHKAAAAQASTSANNYAVYKANWLDTGELRRLNDKINHRKLKHTDYKQVRAQYQSENAEFKALSTRYQNIARDMLDRDRDCAAAKIALQRD